MTTSGLPSLTERELGGVVARGIGGWHGRTPRLVSARLTGALAARTTSESALWLARMPVEGLDAEDRLRRLQLADRVAAWAQAQAAAALADYVGEHTGSVEAEADLRFEVRVSRRGTDSAAGADIASARMLAGVARPVRDLWGEGRISQRHVHAVVDRVARVDDALAAAVMPEVVARLPRMASNDVGRVVARLLARTDPSATAAAAQEARRHDVGVRMRSLPDGLAEVVATLRVEDARAVLELVDARADAFLNHRRGCEPCAQAVPDEIGPARARGLMSALFDVGLDALDDRQGVAASTSAEDVSTGSRAGRGAARRTRRRGETQVVIDLATLLGLADNPGLLGGEPVPAQIARELGATTGSLRRIVTDPLTGHLLDYGTRTYLPEALRAFVQARDGTCTSPGCRQPAARSQLDHVVPFPQGPSSPPNTHMHCKRDHDIKGRGTVAFLAHAADGSARWRTRHGQTGTTPPRPYLNPPEPDATAQPDDDVPPF